MAPTSGLLADALNRSGLSARELSRRSGVAEGRISDYLSGRHDPGAGRLAELLRHCGFDLRLGPRRDANGLVLAELMALAEAQSVGRTRPTKPDPPTWRQCVGADA